MAVISLNGFRIYLKVHLDRGRSIIRVYCCEDDGEKYLIGRCLTPLALIFITMHYQMHMSENSKICTYFMNLLSVKKY